MKWLVDVTLVVMISGSICGLASFGWITVLTVQGYVRQRRKCPRSVDPDGRWPELPQGGVWRIEKAADGLDCFVLSLTPGAAEFLKIDEKGRPSREGRPLRIEVVAPKGWPVSVLVEPGRSGLRDE